jgi:hypothetical protein
MTASIMHMVGAPRDTYWHSRWLFERALAAIYLLAFVGTAVQFVPLLGEHGLEPVGPWIRTVPFTASPSLFYLAPKDIVFRLAAWLGVALSALALGGWPQRRSTAAAAATWAALWVLYLSFVNIGQTFYGFGWEILLCEVGFFTIFAGGHRAQPNVVVLWILRWTLFRLMLGAGLIKVRGDICWFDLTCLDYYYETQPMPNPLSWYFHWMPHWVHAAGVVVNHVVELMVPVGLLLPQPIASIAALVTILFQSALIVSGNLSWLNWLTIVLCVPVLRDSWLTWLRVRRPDPLAPPALRLTTFVVAAVVAVLSIAPAVNMLSPRQSMNASFEPLHLVNTYGAFGTITRERFEIVLEGTDAETPNAEAQWREYEVRGKPGNPQRLPTQVAPYHLRLGWLMWFEAMTPAPSSRWFINLAAALLRNDQDTLSLFSYNPFPSGPPRFVRAQYYLYHFTTPEEHRRTGAWWTRRLVGPFYGPVSLDQFERSVPQ